MTGFTLAAINDAEKTKFRCNFEVKICKINESKNIQELRGGRYRTCIGQSQWNVKYRSRALGQGACLKGMSRTITMPGFTVTAITYPDKNKKFDVNVKLRCKC